MPCYTSDGTQVPLRDNTTNTQQATRVGIRDVRYVNYRVVLVGEITIRFLSILTQESVVFYPEFT